MKDTTHIRFRVDFNPSCSIGHGKIQLLEMIAKNGSLSQAAREMGMSYRRAWLLMDSMNNGFDQPVVNASTGGSGGGGATLTEFGSQLIKTYLMLEKKINSIMKLHMRDIEQHVQVTSIRKSNTATVKAGAGRSLAKRKPTQTRKRPMS